MGLLHELVAVRNQSNQLVLQWRSAATPVECLIYRGRSAHNIDRTNPIAKTSTNYAILSNVDPLVHYYFEVVPQGDTGQIVAERHISLQGIRNFRDIGGYETADGRTVRWGTLYRSGKLSLATDEDLACISNLGIKRVFDLRTPSEDQLRLEENAIALGAQVNNLPMISDRILKIMKAVSLGSPGEQHNINAEELVIELYRSFVTDANSHCNDLIQTISDPVNLPALFHCNMGKDRTGFVSAITLLALGVSKETVYNDFMLSCQYISVDDEALLPASIDVALKRALLKTRGEYLEGAFETIDKQFGSVDAYLHEGLGLNEQKIDNLRNTLLE